MRTVPSTSCATTGTRPRSSNFTRATSASSADGRQRLPSGTGALTAAPRCPLAQVGLGLLHGVLPVVEDRSRERGVGDPQPLGEVLERADAARGDHRDGHRPAHALEELEVVARPRPVPVHAREEELARAAPRHLARPGDALDPGGPRPARHVDLPLLRRRVRPALHVDRDDERLGAGDPREPVDERGSFTAAELTETLSAPACRSATNSCSLRTPRRR